MFEKHQIGLRLLEVGEIYSRSRGKISPTSRKTLLTFREHPHPVYIYLVTNSTCYRAHWTASVSDREFGKWSEPNEKF